MPEYVVDCEHLPYGDGKTLVLPVSIGGHVHERVTRCRDCYQRGEALPYYCRIWHTWVHADGFCHRAKPRAGA